MVNYYPVLLNIENRSCLVVGGGTVGTRKVEGLLQCGAKVRVISLRLSKELEILLDEKRIIAEIRHYRSSDLENQFLVIGATDDEELHLKIKKDAEKRQMLCNIADRPTECNFILPSIIRQKDLIIAISTSGASPAFSKHLRKKLSQNFGMEYNQFLTLMRAIRKKLLAREHAPEEHKPLFEKLINSNIIDLIKKSDATSIDVLLESILGKGFFFEELMGLDDGKNSKK